MNNNPNFNEQDTQNQSEAWVYTETKRESEMVKKNPKACQGVAIAAMSCGIGSLVIQFVSGILYFLVGLFNFPIAVAAVVLAIVSRSKGNRSVFSVLGLIFGLITVGLYVISVVGYILYCIFVFGFAFIGAFMEGALATILPMLFTML